MSFEAAFLGSNLLPNGQTVMERIEQEAVLPLPPPRALMARTRKARRKPLQAGRRSLL